MATPNATDNFQNINASLVANLEKSNKLLEGMGDILQKNQKTLGKTIDSHNDLGKSLEKANTSAGKFKDTFTDVFNVFKSMVAVKTVANIVDGWIKNSQALKDVSFRMGMMEKGYGTLQGAVHKVSQEVGLGTEDARAFVMNLTKLRVSEKDIGALAVAAGHFSEVTGMGAETTARLSGELYKMGKMGVAGTSGVLLTMAKMQRAVGMSEADMEILGESTIKTTKSLSLMGKSASQMEAFAKGTIKLAAGFTSVGLAAQDATSLVEDLLDPTRIENNAQLISQMGLNLGDALEGNIDTNQMSAGLANIGKQMKDMSRPAAAAWANSMDKPLEFFTKAADMQNNLDEMMRKTGKSATEAMAQMQKEQETPGKKLERLGSRLNDIFLSMFEKLEPVLVSIAKFVEPLVTELFGYISKLLNSGELESVIKGVVSGLNSAFGMITGVIKTVSSFFSNPAMLIGLAVGIFAAVKMFKKVFFSGNTEVADNLGKGLTSAVGMASEKASVMSQKIFSEENRRWTDDRKRRIMETQEYKAKQEEADFLTSLSNSNIYFKGVVAWSAKVAREASMGVPGASLFLRYAAQTNQKIRERYDLLVNEGKLLVEAKKQSIEIYAEDKKRLEKRKEQLELQAEGRELNYYEIVELKNINKSIDDNTKAYDAGNKQIIEMEDRTKRQAKNQLKWSSPEDLARMVQQEEVLKGNAEIARKAAETKKENLMDEKDAMALAKKSLELRRVDAMVAASAEGATADEIEAFNKINESLLKIEQNESRITGEIIDQDELIKKSQREEDSANKNSMAAKEALIRKTRTIVDEDGKVVNLSKEEKKLMLARLSGKQEEIDAAEKYLLESKKLTEEEKEQILNRQKKLGVEEQIQKVMDQTSKDALDDQTGVAQKFAKAAKAFGADVGSAASGFVAKVSNTGHILKDAIGKAWNNGFKAMAARGGGTGLFAAAKGLARTVLPKKDDGKGGSKVDLGKAMGGLGMVMGLLVGVFMKNEKIQKLVAAVMKIFGDIVGVLVDNLLPSLLALIVPMLKVMFTLADSLLMPLVKFLLPPLLRILGFLIKALGTLISVLPGGGELGKGLIEAGKGMDIAADAVANLPSDIFSSMGKSLDGIADSINKKTDETAADGAKAEGASGKNIPVWEATGKGSFSKVSNGGADIKEKKKEEEKTKAAADTVKATQESATNTNAMRKLNEEQVKVAQTQGEIMLDMKKAMNDLVELTRNQAGLLTSLLGGRMM